ncbi:Crp/Fnr family transcriptional regulator [Aeromicrobium sp.]|nr:Crp/Fnr family transcriptional regulator [Candidatus Saccharibacteria bacterium]
MGLDAQSAHRDLVDFFKSGTCERFNKNDIVINYGDSFTSAYWIEEGFAKVSTYGCNGDERTYYMNGPGDFLPVVGLIDQTNEKQIFQAVNKLTVYKKTAAQFSEFVLENPLVMVGLMKQTLDLTARIHTLITSPANQRLMCSLRLLAYRYGKPEDGHLVLEISLTQHDIGKLACLSRETAGRMLQVLEDEKAVIVGKRSILVFPEVLNKLMNE